MNTKLCSGQYGCDSVLPLSSFRKRIRNDKVCYSAICLDCESDYFRDLKARKAEEKYETEPQPLIISAPWKATGPRIVTGMFGGF